MNVRAPTWDDFDQVLDVLTAADRDAIGESEWTKDGLRAEWQGLDLEHDAWVVELGDRVAGFAMLEDRGGGRLIADGYVYPELRGRGVGTELIRLTEERARGEVDRHPPDVRVYLQNAAVLADECTPNLYARNGYRVAEQQFRMLAELEAEPEVAAADGVEIRRFQDPAERRAVYEVIDEAFVDSSPRYRRRPFEEWAPRVFERHGFDPSLVWVAVENGRVVGANVCGWKESGDWGWIGSIGVLRTHRGRRIGEALLKTAFAEFWRRGERRVALGVTGENKSGAIPLYERAGMRVLFTIVLYEKELRAAA
jgi:mycothiol synthase